MAKSKKIEPKKKGPDRPKKVAEPVVQVIEEKPKSKRPLPPIEHRWKAGQSGNPLGRGAGDPALTAIKNLTKAELIEIGNLVIKGSVKQLRELKDDEDQTVLKRMLASVCVKVISKGDMQALDVLLNRLVGKVKDDVTVTNLNRGEPARVVVTLPNNNREGKK